MRWAAALSELPATDDALAEAAAAIDYGLDGETPDLVLAFVSPRHEAVAVAQAFPGALVIGCTASGVIGDGHEVEARPAISLTAARLPGVTVTPLRFEEVPPAATAAEWRARAGVAGDPHFIVLADPFTCDAARLCGGLDSAYPEGRKAGGLASGARSPGTGALLLGGELHRSGAVGVALSGDLTVETLVAQGCRPVGRPMVITRCDEQVIFELDRKPATHALRDLYESLDERDRALAQTSLLVALELDSSSLEYHEDQLLVRNLVGMDPSTGALAVAAQPRPWQVLRFVLRDARAAAEDLRAQLARRAATGRAMRGALLFSCLGRGRHLFGRADHDTDLFRRHLGAVPLGGFFGNGEIGPVGRSTFVHAYTSAFVLFGERDS